MVLRRLNPHPALAPYVEKMWLFESDAGIPSGDMRTIVPNGLMKMIISYRGSLTSGRQGTLMRVAAEGSITLVGLQEQRVTIDSAGPTGTGHRVQTRIRISPFPFQPERNPKLRCSWR